jgi:hypothetical protein
MDQRAVRLSGMQLWDTPAGLHLCNLVCCVTSYLDQVCSGPSWCGLSPRTRTSASHLLLSPFRQTPLNTACTHSTCCCCPAPCSTRVLLAPHLYGPTVNSGAASLTGADLYSRLDASWGSLLRDGYCTPLACQQFAVVAGGCWDC